MVLTDSTRALTLTNDSLINADYACLLRKGDTPFTVGAPKGTLAPGEVRELSLLAHCDDAVKSTNDLILQIVHAPEAVVPLSVVGVGATITANRPLDALDLGENFSSRIIRDEIVLGKPRRKPQQLTWANCAAVPVREGQGRRAEGAAGAVFDHARQGAHGAGRDCTFTIKGMSPSPASEEVLVCSAQQGGGKAFLIYETVSATPSTC